MPETSFTKLSTGVTHRVIAPSTDQVSPTYNGTPFPVNVERASSWWRRAVGLLLTRNLPRDQGLWLRPCASVHTIGMAYAIDVIFLGVDGRVRKVVHQMKPMRLAWCWGADSVLELRAGVAKRMGIQEEGRFSGLS
jgi:uncharacterized membrane protein (UPF0127 family)